MEYISKYNLTNQYPTINTYTKQATGDVKLIGLYVSDPKYYELYVKNNGKVNSSEYKLNSITFDKPEISLDNITTIKQTSFNFVLAVKNNSSDTVPKYFTSDQFYKKLKSSKEDGNPYFIGRVLDKRFLVEYDLEECFKIVKDLAKAESENNVTLGNHIFVKSDNSIDYVRLVQYIDWLVSPVSPNDSLNGGVLKAEQLINYDFKVKKLELNPLPQSNDANSGGSGNLDRFGVGSVNVGDAISSINTSNNQQNMDNGAPAPIPTGTDSSQTGSRNYYYNVRNESGAVVTVYWRKTNVPTLFQADYAPGQNGVICAQEGTIDGNITRVLVAGCGS